VTAPLAILVGSLIIAAAIIGSQFIAPYRLTSSGGAGVVWRLNGITGEIRRCNYEPGVGGWPAATVCP
jgi:hypothetical protein